MILRVARGLAASAGACTTKSLTPSLFRNEKDFPPSLTIWMGLFRVPGLSRLFLLLDTQTSQCYEDIVSLTPVPFYLQWFASYLSSYVWTDEINNLEKRCWEDICVPLHNSCIIPHWLKHHGVPWRKAPETTWFAVILGTATINLEGALSNLYW